MFVLGKNPTKHSTKTPETMQPSEIFLANLYEGSFLQQNFNLLTICFTANRSQARYDY